MSGTLNLVHQAYDLGQAAAAAPPEVALVATYPKELMELIASAPAGQSRALISAFNQGYSWTTKQRIDAHVTAAVAALKNKNPPMHSALHKLRKLAE